MEVLSENFTKQNIYVEVSDILVTIDPLLVPENIIYLDKVKYNAQSLLFNNNGIQINNDKPIILSVRP